MSHRYLFIEEVSSAASKAFSGVIPEGTSEHADWEALVPDRLRGCAADLIVPVALPDSLRALNLFRWLRDHPLSTPMLGILPCEPGAQLLQAAAQVVDDFILCPVREEEWRERVTRILGPSDDKLGSVSEKIDREVGLGRLVGHDPAFLRTISTI